MKTPEYVMRRIRCCIALLCITVVAGCANSSKPIIDPAGIDIEQYDIDLAECEQISEQVEQKTGEGAIGGAVIGGLIGVITGNSAGAVKGAGVGAVVGGAKGTGTTSKEKERVVKNCLRNRGYQVLN